MSPALLLFCGGPAVDESGRPKPLMRIPGHTSLLVHFLHHLRRIRTSLPSSITLLCDDGQEAMFHQAIAGLDYPVTVQIQSCGVQATTFRKFESAVAGHYPPDAIVQFGYPDIFFFGEHVQPRIDPSLGKAAVHISSAALTSRFPRLIIDPYHGEVRGISDYSSTVPANPMHVFGGDIWGRPQELRELARNFRLEAKHANPSLEYDFFFWLINRGNMRCVMLHGERLWVDSVRDIQRLLAASVDPS